MQEYEKTPSNYLQQGPVCIKALFSIMFLQEEKQQKKSPSRSPNKQSTDSPCILTYYYIRGLCQPIRNLLYFLNVDFIDRRLDKNTIETLQLDKLQSTFNSGLPCLRDGEMAISDSVAISFYICQKYDAKHLIGKNMKIKSKINEVLFKYWMEKKKIMPEIAEIIKKTTGYYQTEKGVLIRQLLCKLVNQTRFIKFCLKKHQQTQGWILSELTLLDFYFYETCFYIAGFFYSYIEADEKLSYFISFAHKFESLEFHTRVNSQKTKLFFPFKNDNLKEIVVSAWQGDEEQEIV